MRSGKGLDGCRAGILRRYGNGSALRSWVDDGRCRNLESGGVSDAEAALQCGSWLLPKEMF